MKFFKKKQSNKIQKNELTLTELANKFETDKGDADKMSLSWGKDYPEHECMGYSNIYQKYMANLKDSFVKFLEIGIADKRFPYASSKMWLSFFNNIDLYCVDNFWGSYLNEKLEEIEELNSLGANFIHADQGNFCDWNEIKQQCPNDFDFIVEDGSHWPNHMAVTLWQSIDLLKKGGYYFMEDLQNPKTSRGKFKYDNTLLTENLFEFEKTKIFKSHFLNDSQNQDIQNNFELVELYLDKHEINYLAVFIKK